jgi:hypothetical protein
MDESFVSVIRFFDEPLCVDWFYTFTCRALQCWFAARTREKAERRASVHGRGRAGPGDEKVVEEWEKQTKNRRVSVSTSTYWI